MLAPVQRQQRQTLAQDSHKLHITVPGLAARIRPSRHHPLALSRVHPPRPLRRSLHVPDGGDERVEEARVVPPAGGSAAPAAPGRKATPSSWWPRRRRRRWRGSSARSDGGCRGSRCRTSTTTSPGRRGPAARMRGDPGRPEEKGRCRARTVGRGPVQREARGGAGVARGIRTRPRPLPVSLRRTANRSAAAPRSSRRRGGGTKRNRARQAPRTASRSVAMTLGSGRVWCSPAIVRPISG
jgi:hypothetical protein